VLSRGALAWLLLSGLAGMGCRSDAERARLGEVALLASLVDRLRAADNAEKRPLLGLLEQAPCQSASACALKDLCVRAYSVHQTALDEIARLSRAARASDAGRPATVRDSVHDAEQRLETARRLSRECADRQVAVVRETLAR
jgi:hypothetical protein